MADIAFLLIIFFMVAAEFAVRKGVMFNFPLQGEASPAAAGSPVVFDLDQGGRLWIDGTPANLEDIRGALLPRLEVAPGQWAVVRTSGETRFGRIIEILDQLKALGVKNIALPGAIEADGERGQGRIEP
jgi:biopolymer transport protein ExbD